MKLWTTLEAAVKQEAPLREEHSASVVLSWCTL